MGDDWAQYSRDLQACAAADARAHKSKLAEKDAEITRLRADLAAAREQVAGAWLAVRNAMATYHWNRYRTPDEGGTLHSPAVFSSHTHQKVVEIIDAMTDADATAALEARDARVRAEERAKVIEGFRASPKFCDICKVEVRTLRTDESRKAGGE